MSSTWINLDAWKSLKESDTSSHGRQKRIRPNILHQKIPIIEDDNAQENISNRKPKRRRMESLNVTKCNQQDSSEESVEYDPDATTTFLSEVKTVFKPTIPLSSSTKTSSRITEPLLSNAPKKTSESSSNNWVSLQKSFAENINLSESIVECSDSDESNTSCERTSIPFDAMIDECSTDSSQIPSTSVTALESLIETQDSLTPPADPNFPLKKLPKKRKARFVKGGLVERLNNCLSKSKSNLLFWQHHRSAGLISPGTYVRIERVEKTYGRTILHSTVNDTPTMFCAHPDVPQCKKDDLVEVEFDRRRANKVDNYIVYAYVDKLCHIK